VRVECDKESPTERRNISYEKDHKNFTCIVKEERLKESSTAKVNIECDKESLTQRMNIS